MLKKILLLLGAGASYGAGYQDNEKIPIGYKLFLELIKEFPNTWGRIPKDLYDMYKNNYENANYYYIFKYLRESGETHLPIQLLKDVGELFIRYQILSPQHQYYKMIENNYQLFSKNQIIIYTTNYDMLLELALLKNNLEFTYSSNHNEDCIQIIKLHGSCNFFAQWEKPGKIYIGMNENGVRGHIEGPINYSGDIFTKYESQLKQFKYSIDFFNYFKEIYKLDKSFPIMDLYIPKKVSYIGNKQLISMKESFNYNLLDCDNLFIIGINPNINDKYIWENIPKYKGNIIFIGNDEKINDYIKKYELKNIIPINYHYIKDYCEIFNYIK